MIPKILDDIKNYLINNKLNLSNGSRDGRINSAVNENVILSHIKSEYNDIIKISKMRDWYDFSIEKDGEFYPINIKITDTTHADNLNCKLGIYYALSGKLPLFDNEVSWIEYFNKLHQAINENDKDYYFLVINKKNATDIFVNGLKTLNQLQPNGNNLPFQCKWDINRKPSERNFDEAKKFLLSNFGLSIKQRAEIYFIYKRFFGEYLE